ncbi:MAG: class I SAM-dependent methyltransferase [bacterium]|nr:class I SAM-dependent methyltransferase [bacterium]
MPTFEEIYAQHAAEYDALVSREDHRGYLLPAIRQVIALDGIDVVELGAGTGRLTRLLAPHVRTIRAFDRSAHMLATARERLQANGGEWSLHVADNHAIPVADACADLVIAGWSFGHATEWHGDRWRDEIDTALREMTRIARPGGALIILETLGTGALHPAPPTPVLADYYAHLESIHGFARAAIATDYRFESLEEADRLVRFFFGDALADQVQREGWIVLPEWTGLWSKRVHAHMA